MIIRLLPENGREPPLLAPLVLSFLEGMYLLKAVGRAVHRGLSGRRVRLAPSMKGWMLGEPLSRSVPLQIGWLFRNADAI